MSNQNRIMFPHTVDSTIISAFTACPQKAFRTYVQHWKPVTESVHLVAGGAFAKGLEIARKAFHAESLSAEDAIAKGTIALLEHYGEFECPADSKKNPDRMVGALLYYFEQYPLEFDQAKPHLFDSGELGIEFSFSIPLPINHPVTGQPILYTGRCDEIVDYNGAVYTLDDKTTSSLGASWANSWEMRGQFSGYNFAARAHGLPVAGTLVRGVSILAKSYQTMETITYRSDYELDLWYKQLIRTIERMIKCWEDGFWDFAFGDACGSYGGCNMVPVCKASDPIPVLVTQFRQSVWDPLAHKNISVREHEANWEHTGVTAEVEVPKVAAGTYDEMNSLLAGI